MSSMPWVKIYTEMLDDPKIGRLAAALRWRFVELILLAGECDAEGFLTKGDEPLTIEDIAWRLRDDPDVIKDNLERLQAAGLIENQEGVWIVCKFADRQGRSQSEKRKQWREAQQRKRGKDEPKEDDDPTPPANDTTDNPESVINDSSMTHTPRVEKRREEKTRGKAAPPSSNHVERTEIVKHFLIRTGLPAPKTDKAHIKGTQKLWWTPVDEIVELSERDVDVGKEFIDTALSRLKDVTVSDPNSIIKTVRAVYAENHRAGLPAAKADATVDWS